MASKVFVSPACSSFSDSGLDFVSSHSVSCCDTGICLLPGTQWREDRPLQPSGSV